MGGHDQRLRLKIVGEASHFLADPARQDDQVWVQPDLDLGQVLAELDRPFAPRDVATLAGGAGNAPLGITVSKAEMAELRIQHEMAVGEDRAAYARTDGQQQHSPGDALAGA